MKIGKNIEIRVDGRRVYYCEHEVEHCWHIEMSGHGTEYSKTCKYCDVK